MTFNQELGLVVEFDGQKEFYDLDLFNHKLRFDMYVWYLADHLIVSLGGVTFNDILLDKALLAGSVGAVLELDTKGRVISEVS